ncbi:MAG: ParB/RepB/Spo0J family partition protein [Candidatus Binatia bacterium]
MEKKGLGRGLSALIPKVEETPENVLHWVETDRISPNPFQPRHSFDEAKIDELSASIREKGILEPLLVRRSQNSYELIAGGRRLRAAVKAGLKEVPVIVREATDTEVLQLALIENLQREDLNPIDEARAYRRLQVEFGWGQEETASKVGKSRPAVANSIRLLLLPAEVQQEVALGKLTMGQARALLGLERAAKIIAAAREVMAKGLSTRETERLVNQLKSGRRRKIDRSQLDPNLNSLIEDLQRWLGTKVRLICQAKSEKGKLQIEYYSKADFDRVISKLMQMQRS